MRKASAKKVFATAIALSLISPLLPAHSASIAGTKCIKAGTTKSASNMKYTCVKQGSKLIWNKGVAIKPSIKPTLSPTPTPTATPTPKPTVAPNPSPTTTPTPSPTAKPVVIDPIRIAAYNSVKEFKCGASHPNITFTRAISPLINPTTAASMDKLLENDFNCFDSYMPGPINLKVFYVSGSDYVYAEKSVLPFLNEQEGRHLTEIMAQMAAGAWGSKGMAGGFVNWAKDHSYAFLVIHLTDNYIWEEKDHKLITHEFTHVIQDAWRQHVNLQSEADWIRQSPAYFTEGGADSLAYTFEATSLENLDKFMKSVEFDMSRDPSASRFRNITNVDEMLARMKEVIDPKDSAANGVQYPIGGLIGEYLIGKYGFDKYLTIIKNLGTYGDFSENLKNTIGLTQDQMLEAAAPYVYSQWKVAVLDK